MLPARPPGEPPRQDPGVRVHLVDGTYELFRAHFGAPGAKAPAGDGGSGIGGLEVGAVRGLLRSLLALLRDEEVSHVAVAFDHVIESFRNELFPGYKTGEGLDPALLAQFPLAEEAAGALGMVVWPMVAHEADDAIATAAARLDGDPAVAQVRICSPDKDLCQCVRGARVVCLDRLRGRVLDEAAVIEKHGVPPRAIPDLLALVGDTADGIPGLVRWGEKSAAAVLARYGDLDAIPDDEAAWDLKVRGAAALAASLRQDRAAARLYRQLATLRTDSPIDASLGALEWRGARRGPLLDLCRRLGETRLPERVPRFREDDR